jgi:hypothetical protein
MPSVAIPVVSLWSLVIGVAQPATVKDSVDLAVLDSILGGPDALAFRVVISTMRAESVLVAVCVEYDGLPAICAVVGRSLYVVPLWP